MIDDLRRDAGTYSTSGNKDVGVKNCSVHVLSDELRLLLV